MKVQGKFITTALKSISLVRELKKEKFIVLDTDKIHNENTELHYCDANTDLFCTFMNVTTFRFIFEESSAFFQP